jgi:hypothetical protein
MKHRVGICDVTWDYWFPYYLDAGPEKIKHPLTKCIQHKYSLKAGWRSSKELNDFHLILRDFARTKWLSLTTQRPLVKDPIAIFSANWLAHTFDMDVVIVIRNPLAFAGSIINAKWAYPFDHFVSQPALMKCLYPYEKEIREFADQEKSLVEQAALLWNLIHFRIYQYQQKYDDWNYIRHEDLSLNPTTNFQKLYNNLAIEFSPRIIEEINYLCGTQPKQMDTYTIQRDSRKNLESWQTRLSEVEIDYVRHATSKLGNHFYPDMDWSNG